MRRSVLIVLCLIVGAVLCLVVGAVLYLKDDPAPQINYTFRDLEVPAEVAASQPVFMRYTSGGTNSIGIALSDEILDLAGQSTNLLPYAEEIEAAWDSCKEGRAYIDELNQFPGITDWKNLEEAPNILDIELPSFSMHRELCQLYVLHAGLRVQQGKTSEGIEALSRHYAMVRKGLPHASELIFRMLFYVMGKSDIDAVARILKAGDFTEVDLRQMSETFSPLKYEEYSLFRSVVTGYVTRQSAVQYVQDSIPADVREHIDPTLVLFKKNRTLSTLKNIYEPMLDMTKEKKNSAQSILQEAKARITYYEKEMSRQDRSNMMGKKLLYIVYINEIEKFYYSFELKAMSDLLALEIERRLGGALELKDPFSGEAYLYDEERGAYFGVGEDGQPGTDDDIYVGDQ